MVRENRGREQQNLGFSARPFVPPSPYTLQTRYFKSTYLSYHWRHAFHVPKSGPFNSGVVNPDTGRPVATDQLRRADFRNVKDGLSAPV